MRKLFDETSIKGMLLNNRLVRSATWEGMCAPDGRPTQKLAAYYGTLARGGVGLIISGYAYVRPDGKQLPGQLGVHDDAFAEELAALAGAVHRESGRICLQLVHAGGQTMAKVAGRQPVAPSAVAVDQYPEMPAELSTDDIAALVTCFADGARRAKGAGCDAVQLHAAHGYLINQFLSPLTNRREDAYGGSIENRCRFLMQVYRAIRCVVGKDFPVLVKLNGSDNLPGGLDLDDALVAARLLDEEGVDAIEVTGGTPASGNQTPVRQGIDKREQEAYNLPLAYRMKNAVSCPIMVVGGLRSFEVAEGIIRREEADYVSFARPFIREPHLALRWREGNEVHARCISCNGCFKPGLKEGGIYCVVDKIERESRGVSL
ncbi:oxidoreductase [Geobacter argillaceus]|uniref:2,4-dienoyl-CoA reductase-like NADH-dependent reductase (Old Yellow Enzyme family) n=1 Tax=Geobacter argillaceus TaxID=345631 RepID=A0A562WT48_9BACT|nr:NADH:flavin oxidoreductase [Geobacter argillaceus]TWJ33536.1 2,4-dienoyl-CoA reductase-like NADH-dependent reductase (Old Yellow Enzyme family) [Geobacter argillaceus]